MKTVHKPRRLFEEPAKDVEYLALSELKEWMGRLERNPPSEFIADAFYNHDGDSFEVHWEKESTWTERWGSLDLHIGLDSGKVVGVTFHRVKARQGLKEVQDGSG